MSLSPFIIYGLPRSRTYWLSHALSYGGWHCGHDEMRHARSLADVKTWLDMPMTGTVETLAAPWWRLVQEYRPDIRTVVVRRPIAEVVDSAMRCGVPFDRARLTANMTRLDHKLDQIEARVPSVLSVSFQDLNNEATGVLLFQHCLSLPFDLDWWNALQARNLQINMAAAVRYMQAFQQPLDIITKVAKRHVLAELAIREVSTDGLVITQEPVETWLRDGRALIEEHCALVGESPDSYRSKNTPLALDMERRGALFITTARSNGRMFGYLMTIVGASLEAVGGTSAMHMTFFASSDFPGLGMKLHRASVAALRERGINEVFFRAGARGSGPRMGAVYRRLGAEEFGKMFKLDLKAA